MPARRTLVCALSLLAVGCGGGERTAAPARAQEATEAAPAGDAPTGAAGSSRVASDASTTWVDPEPPGAQAIAESVLHDPSNADKTTALRMSMTTIVGATTQIAGSATALSADATKVEDRLTRLGAEVTGTEITIRLAGWILFDFDSDDLRADAERTLHEVAAVVAAYAPQPVRIEGHTDSIASDAYNQALSERRATAVMRWLEKHGVTANRMRSAGFGESKPVADNHTVPGRQQNRRVELVIEKGAER